MKQNRISGSRITSENLTTLRLVSLILAGSAAFCSAGEEPVTVAAEPGHQPGNWCETLQTMGTLYQDSDNPWIQKFKVMARFQYQYGYVNGTDSNDNNFTYDTDEVRRFYAGARLEFLRFFKLQGHADIFDDQKPTGGARGFESQLWDLMLTAELSEALDLDAFDSLAVGYGKRVLELSGEFTSSSKSIKAVERSAIANKVWPDDDASSNPTGGWIQGKTGRWGGTLGVFSTTGADGLAGWSDGQLFYGMLSCDLLDQEKWNVADFILTGFYQNVGRDDDTLADGLEWTVSAATRLGRERWSLGLDLLYGDNGEQDAREREGAFWGVVLVPTYWIWKDRLEGVVRYQYQGSSRAQGIILNSRYVRRAEDAGNATLLNGGRGDEHHSFYLGLNYYLCGDNLKLMGGMEYDHIQSDGNRVYDGWTSFLAVRAFF